MPLLNIWQHTQAVNVVRFAPRGTTPSFDSNEQRLNINRGNACKRWGRWKYPTLGTIRNPFSYPCFWRRHTRRQGDLANQAHVPFFWFGDIRLGLVTRRNLLYHRQHGQYRTHIQCSVWSVQLSLTRLSGKEEGCPIFVVYMTGLIDSCHPRV